MNFTHCPYDNNDIEKQSFAGGFLVLSCDRCGAQWEMHNALIRRIQAPDREVVREAVNRSLSRTEDHLPI